MFSLDPRAPEYPWQSPYVYHSNSPIAVIDYLGGGEGEEEGKDVLTHEIKSGETLNGIADKFNVNVEMLVAWNDNIQEAGEIRAGDEIVVARSMSNLIEWGVKGGVNKGVRQANPAMRN